MRIMAYVVTASPVSNFIPNRVPHAQRTEGGTPERNVVRVKNSTGAASLCTRYRQTKFNRESFRLLKSYRIYLPPLTLAVVLLEQTLVVRDAVFAIDETRRFNCSLD